MNGSIKGQKGFTIVEILLVIALIALLATAVMPKIYDWGTQAQSANVQGTAGALRSAISVFKANDAVVNGGTGKCPTSLESEGTFPAGKSCSDSTSNATFCFDTVLDQAVTDGHWESTSTATAGSNITQVYTFYKSETTHDTTTKVNTITYKCNTGSQVASITVP